MAPVSNNAYMYDLPVQLLWRIRELESLQCLPWNEISPKGHLSPSKWICRGCSVLYSGSKQIINTWYSKKVHGIMQCVVSTSSSLPRPASLLYSILKGYIKAQILLVAAKLTADLYSVSWLQLLHLGTISCCSTGNLDHGGWQPATAIILAFSRHASGVWQCGDVV